MRAKGKRVALGNTFFEEKLNSTISEITKGFSLKMGGGLGNSQSLFKIYHKRYFLDF